LRNFQQFLERKKKGIREMMVSALRSSLDKQGMTKKFVRARAERTGLQRTDYFEREGQEVVATTETEEEIERRRFVSHNTHASASFFGGHSSTYVAYPQ
jgi:hypothetical protein